MWDSVWENHMSSFYRISQQIEDVLIFGLLELPYGSSISIKIWHKWIGQLKSFSGDVVDCMYCVLAINTGDGYIHVL